ncbi:hypothetical protein ABBQ32_006459 [Trebouxia sp. C0010 RCD-2024]
MGSIEEALKTAGAEDDLQTILRVLEDKSVSFNRQKAAAGPFVSMDTTMLNGLNIRMLSAIKRAQQQQQHQGAKTALVKNYLKALRHLPAAGDFLEFLMHDGRHIPVSWEAFDEADSPDILIPESTGGLSHISSLVEDVPFHGGEELTTGMMHAFIPVAMKSLLKAEGHLHEAVQNYVRGGFAALQYGSINYLPCYAAAGLLVKLGLFNTLGGVVILCFHAIALLQQHS